MAIVAAFHDNIPTVEMLSDTIKLAYEHEEKLKTEVFEFWKHNYLVKYWVLYTEKVPTLADLYEFLRDEDHTWQR